MVIEKYFEIDVDLEDFDIDKVVSYLKDEGYKVSKGTEVQTFSTNETIKNIVKACVSLENETRFYRELFTALFNIPFNSDKDVILKKIGKLL